MKLVSALCLFGLGLGAVTSIVAGCGSSDSGGGTTASAGIQPPAPTGAPTTATDDRTFAVYSIQVGDTDRAGAVNRDAWKKYGYDLDGLVTTRDSTNVCTQAPGATKANQEDGDQGIDNAFGKVILPLLPITGPSKQLNDSIQNSGAFTLLMQVKGLTDDPAQTNTGLSAKLLVGGDLGKKPDFSPTFHWPYRQDPQIAINGSYITNGVFVNGDPKAAAAAAIEIALNISGQNLSLRINKPTITFKHTPPNDLAEGTIAGVVATDELISSIEKVAGSLGLCSAGALDSVKTTIRQASDMLKDGTNRAGVPCDAISIGIGFTAKRVANPDPATDIYKDNGTPTADKCGDGGT